MFYGGKRKVTPYTFAFATRFGFNLVSMKFCIGSFKLLCFNLTNSNSYKRFWHEQFVGYSILV